MIAKAKLGLGCYFSRPTDSPEDIVRASVELGINIFDTSPAYGDSESRIGSALREFDRSQFTYMTKTKANTANELHTSFFESMKLLGVEFVDVLFGHSFIDSVEDYESHRSVLDAMNVYKDLGLINRVGVSGHSVEAAHMAISDSVDVIMIPHSISHRRFDSVIQRAQLLNIEVITMKNFASGILLGGYTKNAYNNRITLQDILNFSAFSGADLIIPAARSVAQLHSIFNAYTNARQLTDSEVLKLENEIVEALGSKFCRSCNECRPCVKYGWQMSQSGILRAMLYHEKFGIDMSDVYASFKLNALNCEGCDNLCSPSCSHDINIKSEMMRAHILFTGEN